MLKKAPIDGLSSELVLDLATAGDRDWLHIRLHIIFSGGKCKSKKKKKKKIVCLYQMSAWLVKAFLDAVSCTREKMAHSQKYTYTTIVRHGIYTSLLIINDLILTFH